MDKLDYKINFISFILAMLSIRISYSNKQRNPLSWF